MTSQDSAHDKELLERYRRASDTKPAVPSEAVRAAILAEGRRVAEQATATSQQPFDVSRRAANDSRWKITAFGTAGGALLAALLFAPHLWEHAPGPAPPTSTVPAGPPAAPAIQSPTTQLKSRDVFTAAAENARGEEPGANQYAQRAAETASANAGNAPTARSSPSPASTAGNDQSAVSANRVQAARAKASAEPSGLLPAAASGNTLEIQALLVQGAALDQRDELGRTPLMLAVIDGRREAVRLLLARGADPNAADNSGRTPLQIARQANSREIAALLEESLARQSVAR